MVAAIFENHDSNARPRSDRLAISTTYETDPKKIAVALAKLLRQKIA